MKEVIGFHRRSGYAHLSGDEFVEIDAWFDREGEQCGPFDHPKTAVTKADSEGKYHSLILSEFEPVTEN